MQYITILVMMMIYFIQISHGEDMYTTKYDNMNLDDILHSERLLKSYEKCIMDEGKCTAEGEALKAALKEALETECAKCSEKQKAGAKKVITFLIKNKPDIWKRIVNKYDPTGEYRNKYYKLYGITEES